jgi:hypothetical protein
MTRSLRVGLACFGLSSVALSLSAAFLLPDEGWIATEWVNYIGVYSVVALASVLIGLALGRLTVAGTAICALLIQVAVIAIIIGGYVALSSRGTENVVWPPLLGAWLARVWLGWLAGFAASVLWPVVWLLVIRRVTPRLVASAGS